MFVKRIELKDFRNYKDLDVSFNKNVNIFIGNNAQGKTNLLESIYLNSMARSFKTRSLSDSGAISAGCGRLHFLTMTSIPQR